MARLSSPQGEAEAESVVDIGNLGSAPRLRTFSKKFMPWMTKGGLAILDTALISGSNFLLGILLARWLAPEQYGGYALAFSVYILVAFLYQTLVLEPLSVFSGTVYRENIRGYMSTTLWVHLVISVAVFVVLGAAAGVARVLGHSMVLAAALAGLTVALPFILFNALVRRGFYLKMSPGPAAFGAAFYCALLTAGTVFVYRQGWLTAFTAFLVMAVGALVSGLVILYMLNLVLEPSGGHPGLRQVWKQHWVYGRWALAAAAAGWVPNYVYIPVVGSFYGMAMAGELRAVMNLAAPVLQTHAALATLFLPLAARVQHTGGRPAAEALTRRLTMLFVGGAVMYWAVIIAVRQPLFHFLYAGKYMESAYLIPLFALETIVWSASIGPAILLRGMEAPRCLFVANCYASTVAVVIGIPATRFFALRGVVWSMILANALYVIVAFILLKRRVSTLKLPCVNLNEPVAAG